MKKKYSFLLVLMVASQFVLAQETIKMDTLKEVVISSSRIDVPFKENSRTIQIVTAADIEKLGVANVADALQKVAGIDVRRQGTDGMQSDLYIRGGSFDQTLLLIDGIKVEDVQTGHHTMNLSLPLSVIKRIEIIKGPASRIFGQNAFTGAVNIVTKDAPENSLVTKVQAGSFQQFKAEATASVNMESSSHIVHVGKNFSNGYRENTDFDNNAFFVKSQFNKKSFPINVIAAYNDRKFGANGFYGLPSATEQYEETQATLIGFSTVIKNGKFTWKPRLYWRRNEDEYIYIRSNPSIYRNLHITNKFAAELNGSYSSSLGVTGFGVEFSKYYIGSNRLGDNQREIASVFLEQRFQFFNQVVDVTPGIAASYFSDFDNKFFPGMDIGVKVNDKVRVYGNIGYTYRVPTYTDLYYIGPQAIGNENLQAEEAVSEEVGVKYHSNRFDFSLVGFNRDSKNLIDYVRVDPSDTVFVPLNVQDVTTKGFESQLDYKFTMLSLPQNIHIGYTFLDDEIKKSPVAESRYSINSMKHQVVGTYSMQLFKNLTNNFAYRYVERTSGISYNIYDVSATYTIKNFALSVYANNIFNAEYSETSMIPMPKGNILFGLQYHFQ